MTETLKTEGTHAKKAEERAAAQATKLAKQSDELREAIEEAEGRAQMARAEVCKEQELVVKYRSQKVDLAEQGRDISEMEGHVERAEAQLQAAKLVLQDWEWKVKRAQLKLRDFENAQRKKKARAAGNDGADVNVVIKLEALKDVVIKDVGGARRKDGRWPLVSDTTGKSMTFFRYSGATVFDLTEYRTIATDQGQINLFMDNLLQALLKHLMYGGCIVFDLKELDDTTEEAITDLFSHLEKGMWQKLSDRAVLFAYLLPRRFLSLVPAKLQGDYDALMFEDHHIENFVMAFVTSTPKPSGPFADLFYTVDIPDPDAAEDEEEDE